MDIKITIETNNGKVKGFRLNEFGFQYNQFLGIPYARAPLGQLRFRKPKPLTEKRADILVANEWPNFCKQINLKQYEYLTPIMNYNTSEDCLYLNVWTPAVDSTGGLRPVIVYIHGGVFIYMGISFDIFNGAVISNVGDVVFVTINYRLGLFGFLNAVVDGDKESEESDEGFHTNVGIYDQIMALNWIKDNIKQFGGDPESITLMGQSAGAIAIGLLMSTPLASDLFQRAILESSSPMQMNFFYEISDKSFEIVLQLTNCSQNSAERVKQIECLREIPEQELNEIQGLLMNNSFLSFSPSIPSLVLSQYPRDAFDPNIAESAVKQKQILLGGNADEGSLFLHQIRPKQFPLLQTPDIDRTGVKQLLREFGSNFQNITDSQLELILDTTLDISRDNSPEEIRNKLSSLLGDFLFKCPVIKFADSLTDWPNITVYMYYFTERSGHLPEWVGSSHFEEVQFVFGLPFRFPHKYSAKQREFSQRMIEIWSHFARTGEMLEQMGNVWPKYSAKSGEHMELNSNKCEIGSKLSEKFYTLFEIVFESF